MNPTNRNSDFCVKITENTIIYKKSRAEEEDLNFQS